MTRLYWALSFVLILFFLSVAGFGASRIECSSVPSKYVPPTVRYCVLLPSSSNTSTAAAKPLSALYFLHGLGQDSQSLFNDGLWNLVDDLQQHKKIGEFVIITPDAGRSFYINAKDGGTRYENFFLHEFMP